MSDPAVNPETVEADVDAEEAVMASIASLDIVRESRPPIQVSVHDGTATLSGVVLSPIMHRAVVYMAVSAQGIHRVVDKLVEDNQIAQEVARRLAEDSLLAARQPGISVTCYKGLVTLSGAALSDVEQARAHELASEVRGVAAVLIQPAEAA